MRFGLLVACCALSVSVASFAEPVRSQGQSTEQTSAVGPRLVETATPAPEHQATTGAIERANPQDLAKPAEVSIVKAAEVAVVKDTHSSVLKETGQLAPLPSNSEPTSPAELHAAVAADSAPPPNAGQPTEQTANSSEAANEPAPVQHAAISPDHLLEPADESLSQPPAEPERPASKPEKPSGEPKSAQGDTCSGHPNAIGTSRVITISPDQFKLIGTLQYKDTLPLNDHEVVLTFDDGPIAPYTNSVLDTLESQCVKATYFLVGDMARARPHLVRRIYNEGHSIGTHSQHHPYAFQRLSMQRVESEVDGGIDSVKAALGDPRALSPFFRIPGFGRTNAIDHYLEQKHLVTWSTDIDTNDWWRGSSAKSIVQRAMRRLEEKGRGIILMHDIHPATALALPMLLKELKANGYRVVHVVAQGERPKSVPDIVASPSEKEAWPRAMQQAEGENEKKTGSKSSLRHRVKTELVKRSHQRLAKRKKMTTSSVDAKEQRY